MKLGLGEILSASLPALGTSMILLNVALYLASFYTDELGVLPGPLHLLDHRVEPARTVAVQLPPPVLVALPHAKGVQFDRFVGVGQQVLEAMMEADRADLCGPEGKHDPKRTATGRSTSDGTSWTPPLEASQASVDEVLAGGWGSSDAKLAEGPGS